MAHERIYTISLDKASPERLTNSLHWKAHMSVGAQRRPRFGMSATWSHDSGDRNSGNKNELVVLRPDQIRIGKGLWVETFYQNLWVYRRAR
jgi:hypothetical protein